MNHKHVNVLSHYEIKISNTYLIFVVIIIIFVSCAFVIYNQNNLASLLQWYLFSNDVSSPFSNAKAGQPVTHMRLRQLQITMIQRSKQFLMNTIKSRPSDLFQTYVIL